jgi:L-Ala-D/L-Glu epimerase
LDESLCTIENARLYAESLRKTEFNIRVSKVGGLLTAAAILDIAQAVGIKCHLGAQVGESGILTASDQQFAFARGPFVNCEGAANLFLLKDDITKENLTFGYGGIVKLAVYRSGEIKAGLGITVDETKLMRFTEQGDHKTTIESIGLMANK